MSFWEFPEILDFLFCLNWDISSSFIPLGCISKGSCKTFLENFQKILPVGFRFFKASIPEGLESLKTYLGSFKKLSENFYAIPKGLVLTIFPQESFKILFFFSFCLGFRLYKLERISSFLESGRF